MADAAAGPGPGRPAATALVALLLLVRTAACSAAPTPLGGVGGAAAAAADSQLAQALTPADDSSSPSAPSATDPSSRLVVGAGGVSPGFTLRRITNPRYRPPFAGVPGLGGATVGPLRAIDRVRAQVTHRNLGATTRVTDWEVAAGEQVRDRGAFELTATGLHDARGSALRTIRLEGRHDELSGALGDVGPIAISSASVLQRLRGGFARWDLGQGSSARLLGGVPTPLPGTQTRSLALAGATLDELRVEEGSVSLAALGFGRGAAKRAAFGPADPDSLRGGGGFSMVGVRAPLARGTLAIGLLAGYHDLDGHAGLAAQHALDWSLGMPWLTLGLHDQHATRRARIIGTDNLPLAARQEDRWNAQARGLRGRVEGHFTGVVREGGDSTLAARTVQLGGSGSLGGSGWYSGADFTWDHRLETRERRLSVHAGEVSTGGHALLLRFERSTNDRGRDAMLFASEASLALERGLRLDLEPRLSWDMQRLSQGLLEARVTWPLAWLSSRLSASAVAGAARQDVFRTTLREAEVAITFTPRPRDLARLELRRLSDAGARGYEVATSYDLQAPRYQALSGSLFSRRDSTRITVRVVRGGNRTGVSDALVSLDGREMRFTDSDGLARFDHVEPGVHVVAVEERSLPDAYRVNGSARVFVTIERGRLPDEVMFEVTRPVKKTVF